jgi:Photosynthesis system II assembly factor YCF48
MRNQLIALGSVSALATLAVAGCGSGAAAGSGGAGGGGAGASVSSAAATSGAGNTGTTASPRSAPGTVAGSAPAAPACPAGSQAGATGTVAAGTLTGMQFVSAARGWAVGQHAVLTTSDGGAHWTPQLSGQLNLTSVDFVSGQDGWAVGTSTLLATTDGGAHWKSLPEPCPVIRSVHFISPTTGYAVAGGRDVGSPGASPQPPALDGVVLTTEDGGHTWQPQAAPADAQSVCFTDSRHGWLGAAGSLYATADGGRVWTSLSLATGSDGSASGTASMSVECANGAAWALSVGPGAASSQQPHVGYHADQASATAIFAEQYFQSPGSGPSAQAPGSYAGPFSAISSADAVFVDSCSACGYGTAPWDVASRSGATLAKEGNVGDITSAQAASFLSAKTGWVAGTDNVYRASGKTRSQERIVATTDGGRTWQVQYAGPWTAWTG